MLPTALILSEAAHEYISHFFGAHEEAKILLDRLGDLHDRVKKADAAHEAFLAEPKKK